MNLPPPPGPFDRAPISTLSIIAATALLAGTIGYFIGTGSSLGIFPSPSSSSSSTASNSAVKDNKKSWPNSYEVDVHLDSSDEELMAQQRRGAEEESDGNDGESDSEDEWAGSLKGEFEGHETEEVKLVLCVRTDLGMGKGKIAAQASHATLAVYKHISTHSPSSRMLQRWEHGGQAKVALKVDSEGEMLALQAKALSLGLATRVIQDAGRTQIASGTRTVLGILGPKSVVDGVTGRLKLL